MSEASESPRRIHDPQSIAVASFLGSVLAGAVLWAHNEVRIGRPARAWRPIAGALVVLALSVWLGELLPAQIGWVLALATALGARSAAARWVEQRKSEGIVFEEPSLSAGWAVLAGLVGMAIVLGVVLATVMVGVPEAGGACDADTAACDGVRAALWCEGGHYQRIACGGERGCTEIDGRVSCAQAPGDACLGGTLACEDAVLSQCVDGVMQAAWSCRGPRGCAIEGGRAGCDQSVGAAAEPCMSEGAACTADGAERLSCVEARFRVESHCVGPAGCRAEGERVLCDDPRAVIGEWCDGTGELCSVDGLAWLACDRGLWRVRHSCRGPAHCTIDGSELRCDESIAAVGDACEGEGVACDAEGRTELRCVEGAMTTLAICSGPHGCRAADGLLTCDRPVAPR